MVPGAGLERANSQRAQSPGDAVENAFKNEAAKRTQASGPLPHANVPRNVPCQHAINAKSVTLRVQYGGVGVPLQALASLWLPRTSEFHLSPWPPSGRHQDLRETSGFLRFGAKCLTLAQSTTLSADLAVDRRVALGGLSVREALAKRRRTRGREIVLQTFTRPAFLLLDCRLRRRSGHRNSETTNPGGSPLSSRESIHGEARR
jgi:hypothetical protein